MSEARTIKPKSVKEFPDYLDFEFLRREGIGHIQELAGALWTDHNVHDPGITILEVLCYALTDLGYRANLDIRDLLARPPQQTGTDDNFFTAAEILTNNPLTILDYRKLLIDIDGVRNAWLRPLSLPDDKPEVAIYFNYNNKNLSYHPSENNDLLDLNGLYKVYIELDSEVLQNTTDECGNPIDRTGDVLTEVKRRLHAHRNLCEDFADVIVLADERIGLCADIELKADAFPDDVMVRILEVVREFLSPTLPFYTLKQLIEKGKTPDEIFEGRPILQQSHGFIDPVDLKNLDRRQAIHVSDLYAIILNIEGVSAIKKLSLYNYTFDPLKGEDWVMPLNPKAYRPILAEEESLQGITFYKKGIPYSANAASVLALFKKKLSNPNKVLKKETDLDLSIPKGEYRSDLGEYYSIQNDFPLVYGIGENGLPERTTTTKRQAQALQLKGYLLFFDQLLTNYLAQLSNVRSLFSTKLDENSASFFTGSVDSVPHLTQLLPPTEGGDVGYIKGENIAILSDPSFYKTPQARDHALELTVNAFDNQTIVIETVINPLETLTAIFILKSHFGRTVALTSMKRFIDAEAALKAVEKIRFLASLPESYARIDRPDRQEYGFALVYNPTNYAAYLKNIIESPETFFERKNQFFDHLLRRFAEDFTDYTLLTFALNRKGGELANSQDFARQFAQDKSAFLRDYPDISRNRGKAFDYYQKETVWWGNNISGLEKRVMRLIGVRERATKKLNYFDIAPYVKQFFYEYRSFDAVSGADRVLFRSRTTYDSEMSAEKACTDMKRLAENPSNYLAEKCAVECVFTFKIKNDNGCIIAVHPDTYGSAALRDERLLEVQNIIANKGLIRTFEAHIEGFTFKIKNNNTILLESTTTVPTERDAHLQFHRCIEAAADALHYRPIDDEFGRGFSFEIMVFTEGGVSVLARHPNYYPNITARDNAQEECRQFISRHHLRIVAEQLPQKYGWQMRGSDEVVLLNAIHLFKNKKQAAAAFYRALLGTQDGSLFNKKQDYTGKWTFILLQRQTYPIELPDGSFETGTIDTPIARSPQYFFNESACDDAIAQIQEWVQTILYNTELEAIFEDADYKNLSAENIWALLTSENAQGALIPTQGQFISLLKDGASDAVWLAAETYYDTADDALIDFDAVLKAACADSFVDFDDNGGCACGFELQDVEGHLIATHPMLYERKSDRSLIRRHIMQTVCANIFDFEINKIIGAYRFELRWNTCDEKTVVVLRGVEKHATETEAVKDFDQVVKLIRLGLSNAQVEKNNEYPFRFWIKSSDGMRVAESAIDYDTAIERDNAFENLKSYLLWNTLPRDCKVSPVEICDCILPDRTTLKQNPYTWRVWDDEEVLARYCGTFDSEKAALEAAANLARTAVCCPPIYSRVWLYRNNFETDEKNNVFFILRDDSTIYWRSAAVYPSVDEAQKAFDDLYVYILNVAKDPDAYAIRPRKNNLYVIELTDPQTGILLAESYNQMPDAASVAAETDVLLRHALLFPIIQQNEGYIFRFYEPTLGGVAWESCLSFTTAGAALVGLQRFLDVMTNIGSYRAICINCNWRLELTEVLLESLPFYTSVNQNNPNPDYAWQRIDHFLDEYAQLGIEMVDKFTDYAICCSYGFRMVGENYRLAKLNRAYHSSCEREADRDALFYLFNCGIKRWSNYADNSILKDWAEHQNTASYGIEIKKWQCKLEDGSLLEKDLFMPYFLTSTNEKIFLTEGGYDTREEAEIAIQARLAAFQKALPMMRFIENYLVFIEIKKDKTLYSFGITDFEGQLILIFDKPVQNGNKWFYDDWTFDSEEAVVNAIRERHEAANIMPLIVDENGKIRFEIRIPKSTEKRGVNGLIDRYCDVKIFDFTVYEILWESVHTYDSLTKVRDAYERFITLLQDKKAYTQTELSDGSLSLIITDDEHIFAVHPRTYTTRTERQAAIQLTIDRINTEGVHLIEHILLRPHFEDDRLMTIKVNDSALTAIDAEVVNSDPDFFKYIIGADPYSCVTTVILPYWARRFRNNDFRTFFENTIRRESPAHVLPGILWIKPQQMQAFERQFRCWLMNVGHSDCADKMIEILEQLENVFIDAFAVDCDTGGGNDNIIFLDKTPLN